MNKFSYLCLGLFCGLLLVSAQRPAASGNGPAVESANPNISTVSNGTNADGPSLVTTPSNSTSPFQLARLQALERTSANNNGGKPYPPQEYTLYMVDLHFVAGNLSAQYIAYHYCHFVSADLMQCALYDGREADSRFIGNEYFITQAIFETLPDWERNLWHSHPFEILTGLFVAPDLSQEDELEVLQWLMGTFGKVTDTWNYNLDFPIGPPQVGLALGLVSQVNWTLAAEMDRVLNLNTTYQERQQLRTGLVTPARVRGADNYLFTGYATQYQVYTFPIENNGAILGAANATGPAQPNVTAPVTDNTTIPTPPDYSNLPTSSGSPAPGAYDSLPNPRNPAILVLDSVSSANGV